MEYNIGFIPVDLILNILNVILFVVVVRLLVYKPVKKFINGRKAKIDADLDEAKKAREQAEADRAEYEKKLADVNDEAAAITASAQAEAKKRGEDIVDGARREADAIVSDAKTAAQAERDEIFSSMKGEITEASALMAEKILRRSVNDEDTKRVASEFFDGVQTEIEK